MKLWDELMVEVIAKRMSILEAHKRYNLFVFLVNAMDKDMATQEAMDCSKRKLPPVIFSAGGHDEDVSALYVKYTTMVRENGLSPFKAARQYHKAVLSLIADRHYDGRYFWL